VIALSPFLLEEPPLPLQWTGHDGFKNCLSFFFPPPPKPSVSGFFGCRSDSFSCGDRAAPLGDRERRSPLFFFPIALAFPFFHSAADGAHVPFRRSSSPCRIWEDESPLFIRVNVFPFFLFSSLRRRVSSFFGTIR